MDPKEAWKKCLKLIEDNVPPAAYADWFQQISAVELRDTIFTLKVPSKLYCEHLDEHYGDMLNAVLFRVLGKGIQLQYIYPLPSPNERLKIARSEVVPWQASSNTSTTAEEASSIPNPFVIPGMKQVKTLLNLNEKYTFEEFVSGKSNITAYEASKKLVNEHGSKSPFNPLVICGACGLGKTHLAHAIAAAIIQNKPETRVEYARTCEFMDRFAKAARSGQIGGFINSYKNIDILIIDDIHDLANGKKTQEVLYNIFDYLHTRGKQLVFTSATRINELKNIRQDLISRFKWGLVTEIEMPDEAMRLAILKKQAERDEIQGIPDNVYEYMAKNINDDIRALEGAMLSLISHATSTRSPIDVNLARIALKKYVTPTPKEKLSVKKILEIVAQHFAINVEELLGLTRRREITEARQIAMFLAKKITRESYTNIGRELNRNHATVIHACKTIGDLCISDARVRKAVTELEEALQHYS